MCPMRVTQYRAEWKKKSVSQGCWVKPSGLQEEEHQLRELSRLAKGEPAEPEWVRLLDDAVGRGDEGVPHVPLKRVVLDNRDVGWSLPPGPRSVVVQGRSGAAWALEGESQGAAEAGELLLWGRGGQGGATA